MRKVVCNGHKKLMALFLFAGLTTNANAVVFVDPTNLIQNTITAIQEIASYAKQLSDSIRQIQEFDKHATEFTNEVLGIGDMLGDINQISRDISDIYRAKEDMEQFNKDVSDNPEGFFNDKYKKYTDNYNLYDKCSNLKGDYLNICLRDRLNYAASIKQHSDYGNIIHRLQKQLDKQVEKLNQARSQKDRENAALAIAATQAELEKARSFNEAESIEYRNNQRIIAEQKAELFRQSLAARYSTAEKYKNVGRE